FACFHAELQPAFLEFQGAVESQLVDFAHLLLKGKAHDLRAERIGVEREIGVTVRACDGIRVRRIQGTAGNRQAVVELKLLCPESRADARAAVTFRGYLTGY